MELKRDIYNKLLEWKAANSGHVLEIRGARQVGKTYILDKFARENYHKYIYINMTNTTGRQFLECWHKVNEWQPGTPRREHPIHDAFMMYDEGFIDEKETIVVIDEIQESSEVYSLIRPLAREFKAHLSSQAVTLGRPCLRNIFSLSAISISLRCTLFPLQSLQMLLESVSFMRTWTYMEKAHMNSMMSLKVCMRFTSLLAVILQL